ncbi:MAG: dockerin type I repeat-containing protein [Oscillospiraceae bacterium]|nr:dockerin type I repeat-containing protein [Oscillospiraceae bacterium]
MKKSAFMRCIAIAVTSAVAAISLPTIPAAAVQNISLNIAKVQVTPSQLEESRTVAVELHIDGNEEGFLAAEFGIAYDNRLILDSVVQDTAPGNMFVYADNPDSDYIWFSGASASKAASATNGRYTLMTLNFTLPETAVVGDSYYIGYTWDGLDGKDAYWYSDKGVNEAETLSGHSISGSISIPDPNAPKLSNDTLRMNRGETFQLELTNYTGAANWFSDRGNIADVDNDGTITAYNPGTATIYCIAGTSMLTCDVTVTKEYYYSIIGDSPITLTDPENEVYVEYPNPQGMVVWMSTRPDIVTIDNGRLTGVKNGTAQIVGTCNNVTYVRAVMVAYPEPETSEPVSDPLQTESLDETDVPPLTDHVEPTVASVTDTCLPPDRTSGDLNGDGNVSILDVIILNQNLMIGTPIDDSAKAAADVLRDGVLNEADSLTILKYVVELIPALPLVP